jgi:hypothetical protein
MNRKLLFICSGLTFCSPIFHARVTFCNTSSQMNYGKWEFGLHSDSEMKSSCGLSTTYVHGVTEVAGNYGHMPWGKYCWKPNNCSLHTFSIHKLCHLLKNHSVVIIGDSTQYMFYQSSRNNNFLLSSIFFLFLYH